MRLRTAGAGLLLLLTLGCGGAGGGVVSQHMVVVPSNSNFQTYYDQATIVFPIGTFATTTTVTLVEAPPPHLAVPNFRAIRRTLTFSAPEPAHAFDVWYPDTGHFPQLEALLLDGSQVIATLPVQRPGGQVGIHVDPALIPPGDGPLQLTLCIGQVSQ